MLTILNIGEDSLVWTSSECLAFRRGNNLLLFNKEANLVYWLPILIVMPEILINAIESTKNQAVKVQFDDLIRELLEIALNSRSEYWINMAIIWLEKRGKYHKIEQINDLIKDKNISQRTRHLLRKILLREND